MRRGRSRHELISCWGRGFDPSTLRPLAYPCCLVVYRHCRTCSIPTVSVPRSTASPLVLSRPPNRVSSAGRRGRRRRFRPRSISTGGGGSTLRPSTFCITWPPTRCPSVVAAVWRVVHTRSPLAALKRAPSQRRQDSPGHISPWVQLKTFPVPLTCS